MLHASFTLTTLITLTTLLGLTVSASAADHPSAEQVLARIERAYGGPRLRRLRSLRILSDRRLAWAGQGQTSAFVEFAVDRQHKYFDLKRQYGSVERWIHQTGNVYHHRYIVDARGATTVDHAAMTYRRDAKGTYFGSFAGDYRASDLMLAFHLVTKAQKVDHRGAQVYDGRVHDVVAVEVAPKTPRLEVFVSRDDGLIRRIRMQRQIGVVNIVFASYAKRRGVRYAQESRAFLGNILVEYEQSLSVTANVPISRHLKVEGKLRPEPARVDTHQMTVDMLAPGVFHVGQDDYSLFAQTDDGYIVVNTYPGLKARFEALVAHTQDARPLAHAIVTHHHQDHLDGIQEAVELGAKLHVTRETEAVLARDKKRPPSLRVLRDQDAVGPFTVYVRPTGHAVENAFVYHSKGKLLFQDDHYHGLLQEGPTWAQPTAVTLHAIIKQLGISVSRLLSGHARKAERWSDFETAVKRTRPGNLCPSGRKICRDQ